MHDNVSRLAGEEFFFWLEMVPFYFYSGDKFMSKNMCGSYTKIIL